MTQANSIAGAMEAGFSVPHWATGTALALLVGVIILGGLKKDSRVYGKDCALYECILFNWLSGGHRGPRRQTASGV